MRTVGRIPPGVTVHHPIHLVVPAHGLDEPLPVCGASSDDLTWTTLRQAMTCPECARVAGWPGSEHPGAECVPGVVPGIAPTQRASILR